MHGARKSLSTNDDDGCSVDERPTPKLSEPSLAVFEIASVTSDRLQRAACVYTEGPIYSTSSASRCRELARQLAEIAAWVSVCNEHGATEEQKRRGREAMMKLVDESAALLGRVGQWL